MPSIAQEHTVLRDLAGQVAEIAASTVQQETIALWKALNALQPVRPMVMIDQIAWHEMNVDDELTPRCEDGFCRHLEGRLRRTLYSWRHLRADMVVEPVIEIPKAIRNSGYGLGVVEECVAIDPRNDVVSHHYVDQLRVEADLDKIHMPEISLDEAATAEAEEKAHDIFDGLLEVRLQGACPSYAPLDTIVMWRGAEPLLYDMADRPEFIHRIIARVTQGQLYMLDQLEAQGLLGSQQQTIHCTGAYTDELPAPGCDPAHPRAKDLWTCGMSQIFSTVSPAMHEEFELPYLGPWFARFGLAYYGCCEPLDKKLPMIRKLPNVRKISMSPWVDVEYGASQIGREFVFSRKPSPAFLAVDDWNPAAVERDLRETLEACARHGCPVELILKDISTVRYQPQRLWEWAETARRVVGA
jgi:hypothetical protein